MRVIASRKFENKKAFTTKAQRSQSFFSGAELIRRGYTDEQLKGIAGLNVLRVMRKAESVAARLQKEKPPSDVRIDEVGKPVTAQRRRRTE